MAMKRFPLDEYASLELNQVEFVRQGMVISQTPLGAAFTKAAPCENGMWVCADKSTGAINAITAVTDPIGIVYTSEKEYEANRSGLKNFGRKIAGDYPRVGIFSMGDTVTTNCLQYDDSEFASETALFTALAAHATTAVYVVPVANSTIPKITASKPNSGMYAKVTKFYTVPNGERGVKYQIVHM